MDLDQAEARIKKREIGGVLYAHTYGEESTPNDFFKFAKSLNSDLILVDDRCLCVPTFDESSCADVVLFSTGYAKIVELNAGGYAFMQDDIAYQAVHLKYDPTHHDEVETSYKTAIQNHDRFIYRDNNWLETESQLPTWDEYRKQIESELESSLIQHKILNEIYSSRLPAEIQMPQNFQTWRFNVRVKNKSPVIDAIFANGLFASSHYASLAGIMADGRAPVAESLANDAINLFNDHHFTPQMAERVCELIVKYES